MSILGDSKSIQVSCTDLQIKKDILEGIGFESYSWNGKGYRYKPRPYLSIYVRFRGKTIVTRYKNKNTQYLSVWVFFSNLASCLDYWDKLLASETSTHGNTE